MILGIFSKKKLIAALSIACLLPVAVTAQGVTCLAETQCRGDAERMCAPSSLSIKAERRGAGVDMWIDRQGPYRAEMAREVQGFRLTLPLFKGHEMILKADGTFLYRGNRGKRYSGLCAGEL